MNFVYRLKFFGTGLLSMFLAHLVAASFGWMKVRSDFPLQNVIGLFLVSLVIWTVIYLAKEFIYYAGLAILDLLDFWGLFLIAIILGAVLPKVSSFVLPEKWVLFSEDGGHQFGLGVLYAIFTIFALRVRWGGDEGDDGGDQQEDEPDPSPPSNRVSPPTPHVPSDWRN
jgi:hypothetical protein